MTRLEFRPDTDSHQLQADLIEKLMELGTRIAKGDADASLYVQSKQSPAEE